MSDMNIIRAWKDSEYRDSLTELELSLMPAHPAGLMELTDEELAAVAGGKKKKNKKKNKKKKRKNTSRSRSRSNSRSRS